MAVFWDVVACNLLEIYRQFKGAYCLHCEGVLLAERDDVLPMEAVIISQMSINFYETTLRTIPEKSHHLRTPCHRNLKFHIIYPEAGNTCL
jgi:hypothetical protein